MAHQASDLPLPEIAAKAALPARFSGITYKVEGNFFKAVDSLNTQLETPEVFLLEFYGQNFLSGFVLDATFATEFY